MNDPKAADEPPLSTSNHSWAKISAHVSNLNPFGGTGGSNQHSTLSDSTSDRTRVESTNNTSQDDTISGSGGVATQDGGNPVTS